MASSGYPRSRVVQPKGFTSYSLVAQPKGFTLTCKYYNTRKGCKFGSRCRYKHVDISASILRCRNGQCRDYNGGECKYGDRCKFAHDPITRYEFLQMQDRMEREKKEEAEDDIIMTKYEKKHCQYSLAWRRTWKELYTFFTRAIIMPDSLIKQIFGYCESPLIGNFCDYMEPSNNILDLDWFLYEGHVSPYDVLEKFNLNSQMTTCNYCNKICKRRHILIMISHCPLIYSKKTAKYRVICKKCFPFRSDTVDYLGRLKIDWQQKTLWHFDKDRIIADNHVTVAKFLCIDSHWRIVRRKHLYEKDFTGYYYVKFYPGTSDPA